MGNHHHLLSWLALVCVLNDQLAVKPTEIFHMSVWSLKFKSTEEILWTGSNPTSSQLNEILAKLPVGSLADELLSDLAAQVLRSAPPKSISILLSFLACHFWRAPGEAVNIGKLTTLQSSEIKSVCGHVFVRGDLVWSCRSCAKDPTCVQCDKCFKNSEHTNHEVVFYRSQGSGGCCDCGDPEAWAPSGNCKFHCGTVEEASSNFDPSTSLPAELTRGLRAVMIGVTGVLVSYSVCTVRGFKPWEANQFVRWADIFQSKLVGRLHNDDVHSFEEVIAGLRLIGTDGPRAEAITNAVHLQGESVVLTSLHPQLNPMRTALNELGGTHGLLFSVVPESLAGMELRMSAAFAWMQSLGNSSDGLQRIISTVMFSDIEILPSFASVFDRPATATMHAESASALYDSVCPNHIFAPEYANQFPTSIQHIPSIPSNLFDESGGNSVPGGREDSRVAVRAVEEANRFLHPFDSCPRLAFPVIMMASPYLNKHIKKAINTFIVIFQQDQMFKMAFSQTLTLLYPSIQYLFTNFIGPEEHNILSTSVQVYTANSVVDLMSSDGASLRPFVEPTTVPMHISQMLMTTLRACLASLGCGATGSESEVRDFLTKPALRNHRLTHLIRDLGYVFGNSDGAVRMLAGLRDPDMVRT